MKQIRLSFQNDTGSINYLIDAEQKTYSTTVMDAGGKQVSEETSVINDPRDLAKRLFWLVQTALTE